RLSILSRVRCILPRLFTHSTHKTSRSCLSQYQCSSTAASRIQTIIQCPSILISCSISKPLQRSICINSSLLPSLPAHCPLFTHNRSLKRRSKPCIGLRLPSLPPP